MTTKQKKPAHSHGRTQARHSKKATQHRDYHADVNFSRTYARAEADYQLYRNFRFEAHVAGQKLDMSGYVTQATWTEMAADDVLTTTFMPLAVPVTGTLTLTKPALDQYKQLVPAVLTAQADAKHHTDRWGAVGVVFVASVGWGRSYVPLWALRVGGSDNSVSNVTGQAAEQISLEDGSWTLNVVDGLTTMRQINNFDQQFRKGKHRRKKGWRCDEIAATVCKKYRIPVAKLARGTSYFELTDSADTHNVDPLTVITAAYHQEMRRTGKVFVIRWGAPTKRHPLGALEVTPLRRNKTLFTLRKQLIDATLSRSQSLNFATVVEGIGKLRHGKGKKTKTKEVRYTARSEASIKRFGVISKKQDFKMVSSHAELEVLTKRMLTQSLVPVRVAELTHPGLPTVHAGDAVRIDIPEEGYSKVNLAALETPTPRHKSTALTQAEKDDPTLFAKPDKNVLTGKGNGTTSVVYGVTNVPDQGIVFVTNIQHSLSAGSYTVDMQTGFTDILDPNELRDLVDLSLRKAKAAKRKSKKKG